MKADKTNSLLKYPSANQLRYAQSLFPSLSGPLPPHVINQILIETDDDTFFLLRSTDEFLSFCSSQSAFSEYIYEERARKRVADFELRIKTEKRYSVDIIQFKPKDLKWREFNYIMKQFIDDYDHGLIYTFMLAREGKLMELKILYATTGALPKYTGLSHAAENGHLDVLKWIYEQYPHLFPDIIGANYAAGKGHLNVIEWIYETSLRQGRKMLPNIEGARLAYKNGHLDIVNWIASKDQKVMDWLATKIVFPHSE